MQSGKIFEELCGVVLVRLRVCPEHLENGHTSVGGGNGVALVSRRVSDIALDHDP